MVRLLLLLLLLATQLGAAGGGCGGSGTKYDCAGYCRDNPENLSAVLIEQCLNLDIRDLPATAVCQADGQCVSGHCCLTSGGCTSGKDNSCECY